MHFLSDAYRLREAIIAERREERAAKPTAAVRTHAPKTAPEKTGRRPFFFMTPAFRFPLVARACKSK